MHDYIEIEDTKIPAFLIEPMTDPKATVIVLPSVFGIDEDVEFLCEDIANMGVTAVAVDPFWATDPGPLPHTSQGAKRALARKNKIPRLHGISNAVQYCKSAQRFGRPLIALGICYGGHLAFCSAAEGVVDAAVVWHGGGLADYSVLCEDISVPLSLHFGGNDAITPSHEIEILRKAFKGRSNVEIRVHPDAGHGFTHRASPNYDESSHQSSFAALAKMISDLSR
jgi:carboxymethylenebutenolidase